MKPLLFALLVIGLSMAFSVRPDYIAVKDTGGQNLSTMNVGIMINCDNRELGVTVTANDTGVPISGAKVYDFYTMYNYQLINTSVTDQDGHASLGMPGNLDYLTYLFILRTDSPGYKSREIEFMYTKCFQPQPPPAVNNTQVQPPQPNITQTQPGIAQNATPQPPPAQNITGNGSIIEPNATAAGPPPVSPKSVCPIGLVLLGLALWRR